jgi:hypothetical protein
LVEVSLQPGELNKIFSERRLFGKETVILVWFISAVGKA